MINPLIVNRFIVNLLFCLIVLNLSLFSPLHANNSSVVRIGVLAHQGKARAIQKWQPTTQYLEKHIKGYQFKLVTLSLDQMNEAVKADQLDFILTNTGNYVNLEAAYGITRIATLKNMRQGNPYTSFGAVILVRADRDDIKTLADLKGKTFAAVSKKAFGGFQMAWRELKNAEINPFTDFSKLEFVGFPQDDIVRRVLDGTVDAGTVRTDTLERMTKRGEINPQDFRILNNRETPGFPFLHSTDLYPEWPFARARNTADDFATRVVIALLSLRPDDAASVAGLNAGWTVPLSYQSVHEMFRELKIGVYAENAKVSLKQVIKQYWYWLMMLVAGLVFGIYHIIRVDRLVSLRTAELSSANMALEEKIVEHLRLEQEAKTYQEHLQLIMNSTAEALLGIDQQGKCSFANQNCIQILGFKLEQELLGIDIQNLIHINLADCQEQQAMPLLTAIQQGKSLHSDKELLYCSDGSSFPIEYWLHPIESDGVNKGYVLTFINITRRKQIDEELNQHREQLTELVEARTMELNASNKELTNNITILRDTQGQLVQAEKMASLGGLVAGFSHEINTPLGVSVTSASSIQDNINDLHKNFESGEMKRSDLEKFLERSTQGCDILLRNLQRASELIRGFKQVAVDQSSDAWRNIQLHQYIDEIILSLSPKWKKTQVKILNDCDPDLIIYSHPGAIYQVLSNLIINALIYAFDEAQPGQIKIKAKQHDGFVYLDLADNGNGISDVHKKNIFDPFYTTRRGSGGSGLGLHIVYNLITGTLKGNIDFSSQVSQGTTFNIAFPFITEEFVEQTQTQLKTKT